MTRLQKLVKIIKQEQELVRQGAESEQLCRHQDRLLQHVVRTGKAASFELFTIPESQVNADMAELKLELTCGK
jgi:hypothetical protein